MNLRRVREMQDYSGSERSAAFAIRSACARAVIEAACDAIDLDFKPSRASRYFNYKRKP